MKLEKWANRKLMEVQQKWSNPHARACSGEQLCRKGPGLLADKNWPLSQHALATVKANHILGFTAWEVIFPLGLVLLKLHLKY